VGSTPLMWLNFALRHHKKHAELVLGYSLLVQIGSYQPTPGNLFLPSIGHAGNSAILSAKVLLIPKTCANYLNI